MPPFVHVELYDLRPPGWRTDVASGFQTELAAGGNPVASASLAMAGQRRLQSSVWIRCCACPFHLRLEDGRARRSTEPASASIASRSDERAAPGADAPTW